MTGAAAKLAELMNRREAWLSAGAAPAAHNDAAPLNRGAELARTAQPPAAVEVARIAAGSWELHLDKVAAAVCRLLGLHMQPRLKQRLRGWPQVSEEAEDICQLAALAFMEAYRQGRIQPDEQAGCHTARSVAAYAWGIANRVFAGTVRRSQAQRVALSLDDAPREVAATAPSSLLDELLPAGPGDADSRLWEVLACVASRCRPEDVIVTYLIASGVTVGEIRRLLAVSVNTPANALRRVGRELRSVIGLAETEGETP